MGRCTVLSQFIGKEPGIGNARDSSKATHPVRVRTKIQAVPASPPGGGVGGKEIEGPDASGEGNRTLRAGNQPWYFQTLAEVNRRGSSGFRKATLLQAQGNSLSRQRGNRKVSRSNPIHTKLQDKRMRSSLTSSDVESVPGKEIKTVTSLGLQSSSVG